VTSQPQVPSPMHAALGELYASISKDRPAMADALKSACQQVGGGAAWSGSAAAAWGSQLDGYSGDLSSSIAAAVAEVGSALASTPATCTEAQARAEEMILSGRLGQA
jgi:hypothetical protein